MSRVPNVKEFFELCSVLRSPIQQFVLRLPANGHPAHIDALAIFLPQKYNSISSSIMTLTTMNGGTAQNFFYWQPHILSLMAAMTLPTIFALSDVSNAADATPATSPASMPIRTLLVTGGKYHDYNAQSKILTAGISARANVQWAVFHDNGNAPDMSAIKAFFSKPDWSKGFDVIVYNDSFQRSADLELVNQKLAPHRAGLPAVILHGTVHTHVDLKTDEWREFIGIRSPKHGPAQDFIVSNNIAPDNPIMRGFPATWDAAKHEELYDVDEVMHGATPLAQAHDKHTGKDYCVIWTNLYGPAQARVFGTSLAHRNATMQDSAYLDLVTRGLLWSVNKLDDAHLRPAAQVMLDGSKVESTFRDQNNLSVHQ